MFNLGKKQTEEKKLLFNQSEGDIIRVKKTYEYGDNIYLKLVLPPAELQAIQRGMYPYLLGMQASIPDPVQTRETKNKQTVPRNFFHINPKSLNNDLGDPFQIWFEQNIASRAGYLGGPEVDEAVHIFRDMLTPSNPSFLGMFTVKEKQKQGLISRLKRTYGDAYTTEQYDTMVSGVRTLDMMYSPFYWMTGIIVQPDLKDGYSVPMTGETKILDYPGMLQQALWNAKRPESFWSRATLCAMDSDQAAIQRLPNDIPDYIAASENTPTYDLIISVIKTTVFGRETKGYNVTVRESKTQLHPDSIAKNNPYEQVPSIIDYIKRGDKSDRAIAAMKVRLGEMDKQQYKEQFLENNNTVHKAEDAATDKEADKMFGDKFGKKESPKTETNSATPSVENQAAIPPVETEEQMRVRIKAEMEEKMRKEMEEVVRQEMMAKEATPTVEQTTAPKRETTTSTKKGPKVRVDLDM